MPKNVHTFVLLMAVAVVACFSAGAAVLKLLYLDDMAEKSAVVVHATVISSRTEWNSSRSAIMTVYTARSHRYLKGFLGETFEFREPGGQIGNLVMDVPGVPAFRPNEEAVLFLWTDGQSGRHRCIGMEQGALRARQEGAVKMVNRSIPLRGALAGEASASRAQSGTALGTSRELGALLAEVAAAVARAQAASAAKEVR